MKDKKTIEIEFAKMPTLKFGKVDRNMQILNLLIELAPISMYEFAKEYENIYGVKKETVLANYVQCISEYLYNGIYNINYAIDLSKIEEEYLRKILNKDIYYINEIKNIYTEKFKDGSKELINSYNLKKLGYKIINNMVLSDKYQNLDKYYRKLLSENEVIDIQNENIKGIKSSTFYVVYNELKKQLEIFEYEENKIITRNRLEKSGVQISDIKEYIEAVYNFEKNELFTIKSLKNMGFFNKLENLRFDDWFYANLLSTDSRFKSKKIGLTIIFRQGTENVSISDFIEFEVVQRGSIDIYELQDLLCDFYGLNIEKYKILETAKEKQLYYNSILEKIYIDYDEYFEEV